MLVLSVLSLVCRSPCSTPQQVQKRRIHLLAFSAPWAVQQEAQAVQLLAQPAQAAVAQQQEVQQISQAHSRCQILGRHKGQLVGYTTILWDAVLAETMYFLLCVLMCPIGESGARS